MAQLPDTLDIKRKRGDTLPLNWVIEDANGAAINITGFSFLLTVDPDKDPPDAVNNLFQLTGTITDAANGKVQFTPSVADANQTPDTYFYDLQQTDTAAKITTVREGKWEVTQDITK